MKPDMTDTDASPGQEQYTAIALELLPEPDVDEGRLFSAHGLRTNGKIFVMLSRGDRITVKLPAERCAELAAGGRGVPFEAGGRQMREWLSLNDPAPDEALALAREALAFLRELHGPAGRPPA
jgi:hypothetical protein